MSLPSVVAASSWRLTDADWNSWPQGLGDAAVFEQAADLGLQGMELGVYDPSIELAPARLAELDRVAGRTGVPVSAVLLSLPVQRWPGGALSGEVLRLVEQVRACADVCRSLGLGVLGLWPGADRPGDDVLVGLRRCVEAAGDVRVAVEPKPGTAVGGTDEALALCEAVDGLGVLLDTGHAFAAGEDPAVAVRRLGQLLLHVHLGDAAPGGGDDDLPCGRVNDFTDVIGALDASGFSGSASFDLYGAVSGGSLSAVEALRESRDHLLSRRT